MTPVSLHFEMTDAVMAAAVREDCLAQLKEALTVPNLVLVATSSGIFLLALGIDGHWLWWISAVPFVLFAGVLLIFAGMYFWWPRAACARLKHLPHRLVDIEATSEAIAFRSATESLAVAWSEIKTIARRPNSWIFCLRSGARIPIPLNVLPATLVEEWQAEFGQPTH
jgi:hypothetical protein